MTSVRLARRAMACRFELVLHGEDPVRLRAAGEEALAEIDRLEAQLSFYRPTSEISRINARAAVGPVPVEPRLFGLLQTAQRLHDATAGAFDPTVGPLMRAWGFTGGTGHLPAADALAEARAATGMALLTLDPEHRTVAFARPGVQLDLGGIGKGFAIDEAVLLLEEAGVDCFLLHGGTSTICARGRPPGTEAWKVAIPRPEPESEAGDVLAVVTLNDEALSVSAVWGKAFTSDGATYGHVLDPRAGRPVAGALLAVVAGPSATETDALSTALLVLGRSAPSLPALIGNAVRALTVFPAEETGEVETVSYGLPAAARMRGTP